MTITTEAATKTLNDLMDTRDQLVGRSAKLASERQKISYAAHTGDKAAKERLRALNDQSILSNAELESVDAAIVEATSRLATAQQAEAQVADRANAEQLRTKLAKFRELGAVLDDCFADFKSAALEMKIVLDDIHNLGCAAPSSQLFKVNCDLAFKTAVQGTPFWNQDFPALAPSQRKTFGSLVNSWSANIEANIAARLGTNHEEAAA